MSSSANPIAPTSSDVVQALVTSLVVSTVIVAVIVAFVVLRRRSTNRS